MFGRPPTGSAANRPTSKASWGRGANQLLTNPNIPPRTATVIPPSTGINVPPSTAKLRPGTSIRGSMLPHHERPMTQQGIVGPPKTGVQGNNGRMIQDRSYWIGELKQRLNLLDTEFHTVRIQIEQSEKENASFVSLEKRAQTTAQELRDIQGQLGDYNTLIDKLHTDADLEDIQKQAKELNAKNTRDQESVDTLFMERRNKEQSIKELELKLANEKESLFHCISKLGEEAKQEWTQLKAEQSRYENLLVEQQRSLTSLQRKKEKNEKLVYQDPLRQKAWRILDRKQQLEKQLQELQHLERSEAQETKETVLQKIKQTNTELQQLEKQVVELEQTQKQNQQEMEMLESESKQDDKLAKYEELVKKDQEITEFLAQFPSSTQSLLQQQHTLQQSILQALTELHRLATVKLGTPSELKQVHETVQEKEKELKQTELTVDTMSMEKERLRLDLEKVKTLGTKIELEKQSLLERQRQMQQEMEKFQCVNEIKTKLMQSKSEWEHLYQQLQRQCNQIQLQVKELGTKYEMKLSQLKDNKTYQTVHGLATKWKQAHSTNSTLQQCIDKITEASNYQLKKKETMDLVEVCLAQNIKLVGLSV